MFSFDLKRTEIYRAVERESTLKLAGVLKRILRAVFIVIFFIFLFGYATEVFSQGFSRLLLGLSLFSLSFFALFWWENAFFNLKLKRPKLEARILDVLQAPEKFNLAEFLSFEAARAVFKSIRSVKRRRLSEVNSSILFYFLILCNPKLNFIFSRAILDLDGLKKALKDSFKPREVPASGAGAYSIDFQNTILEALRAAAKKNRQRVELGDILTGLAKHNPIFGQFLIKAKLKEEDIESLVWWLESLEEKSREEKKWWEYRNLMKRGTLAKEWAAGYTITLDKYSRDWGVGIKQKKFEEIIGHEAEIKIAERILTRSEINNVLLVGEPGTGRGSIVQALAQKSFLGEGPEEINYKRFVELKIPALVSKIEDPEETEAILDRIFQEVIFAGNIILIINEFHNFVSGLARPGAIDISGVLAPYLKLPKFQIIAITTYDGLHRHIERNPSILSLFEKVEVSEISREETIRLLENLSLILEKKYKIMVSYPAIRDVFLYSKRYMPAAPFPKKAIDVLDEIMVYVADLTNEKLVLSEHVAKIIAAKTEIPVGELDVEEKNILLNLENLIHQRIINQDKAVEEISAALRRARAEVVERERPMGNFLFLGPTGVGKTETAKAVAEIYFKSKSRMIRLDMSEFQAVKDIPMLIGSLEQEGLLTTQVRENPFSLVLLDEIEKAHPNILNLFLQVLDDGRLTDGTGRKVSFLNTIIIATSNAGYKVILQALKEMSESVRADARSSSEWHRVKEKLLDELFEKGIFRPEFINRFDAVVVFQPLGKENLLKIAELMFQGIKKSLKEKHIDFTITEPLKEKIVELGYNPVFGARDMRRVIQEKVEDVLARALLSDQLKKGDRARVEPREGGFELIID